MGGQPQQQQQCSTSRYRTGHQAAPIKQLTGESAAVLRLCNRPRGSTAAKAGTVRSTTRAAGPGNNKCLAVWLNEARQPEQGLRQLRRSAAGQGDSEQPAHCHRRIPGADLASLLRWFTSLPRLIMQGLLDRKALHSLTYPCGNADGRLSAAGVRRCMGGQPCRVPAAPTWVYSSAARSSSLTEAVTGDARLWEEPAWSGAHASAPGQISVGVCNPVDTALFRAAPDFGRSTMCARWQYDYHSVVI